MDRGMRPKESDEEAKRADADDAGLGEGGCFVET